MYECIQSQYQKELTLPITRLCSAFGVSRSGYYDWLRRPEPTQSEEDMEIRDQIQRIVLEFPGYGYRRVTPELRRRGYVVARNRVLEIMREDNLLCLRKHRIFRTTDWQLDDRLDTSLTLAALQRALKARWHPGLEDLVHHSDRGVQYASSEYTECLKAHNIAISMSRKAQPLDNPFAESFIKTLKAEGVYLFEYETRQEAFTRIPQFIEDVYNRKRLHSSLGYLPPDEFEQQLVSR